MGISSKSHASFHTQTLEGHIGVVFRHGRIKSYYCVAVNFIISKKWISFEPRWVNRKLITGLSRVVKVLNIVLVQTKRVWKVCEHIWPIALAENLQNLCQVCKIIIDSNPLNLVQNWHNESQQNRFLTCKWMAIVRCVVRNAKRITLHSSHHQQKLKCWGFAASSLNESSPCDPQTTVGLSSSTQVCQITCHLNYPDRKLTSLICVFISLQLQLAGFWSRKYPEKSWSCFQNIPLF